MTKRASIFRICILSAALLLAWRPGANAQNIINATFTVTNSAITNGSSLTINGDVYTWTNNTPAGSFWVLSTNNVNISATNLFSTVSLVQQTGVRALYANTNAVTFSGPALTAAISTNWGVLSFTTNLVTTNVYPVLVPALAVPSSSVRVYIDSQLVADITANSTNAFAAFCTALSNYFCLSATNIATGPNYFSSLNGTVGVLTNGAWLNPNFTNAQNFGNPFRSPGTGTGSEQFGLSASATASFAVAIGDVAQATAQKATALGNNAEALAQTSTAVGYGSQADGTSSIALGNATVANNGGDISIGSGSVSIGGNTVALGAGAATDGASSIALGFDSVANYANSTAVGQNSATTQTNQIMLGVASGSVYVPGTATFAGNVTNITAYGLALLAQTTNILNGAITHPRYNNGTLANGYNADISPGTNLYVKLSGPSAAFTNAGFAGGMDGRMIIVQNSTGQTMAFLDDSGLESTATNRIRTGLSGTLVITNNPGVAMLIYDLSDAHWIMVSHN